MRIRIRSRANDHKHCNWLKWQSLSRMFQENHGVCYGQKLADPVHMRICLTVFAVWTSLRLNNYIS
jgi:hypothetical protein